MKELPSISFPFWVFQASSLGSAWLQTLHQEGLASSPGQVMDQTSHEAAQILASNSKERHSLCLSFPLCQIKIIAPLSKVNHSSL